jgi:hypothetical protein
VQAGGLEQAPRDGVAPQRVHADRGRSGRGQVSASPRAIRILPERTSSLNP